VTLDEQRPPYRSRPVRPLQQLLTDLQAEILSLPTIEYRLRETIMGTNERQRARDAIAEDKPWLDSLAPP